MTEVNLGVVCIGTGNLNPVKQENKIINTKELGVQINLNLQLVILNPIKKGKLKFIGSSFLSN